MGARVSGRRGRRFLQLLSCLLGAWACNNLLGIDEGRLVCDHTSDCPSDYVCLYQKCSPECVEDVDCPDAERCTPTDLGPRCVAQTVLDCEGDEDCEGGAQCKAGSCLYPCSNDDDCVSGQRCEHLSCVSAVGTSGSGAGGEAGAATDGAAGAAGSPSGSCQEAQRRCPLLADASREICRAGSWQPEEPCGAGTICDSSEAGNCTAIAEECLGQASGAATCAGAERAVCGQDLVSVERETCLSAAHCNQATGPDCAACLEAEFRCEGDVLEVCNERRTGFDEVETCTDSPCNAILGECTDRVCDADQFYCDATTNTLQHCNADGSGFAEETPCGEGICDQANGECDVCQAGETLACEDGENQRICSSDGQQVLVVACAEQDPETPICLGAGVCVSCTPSSAECLDEHRRITCNAQGQWSAPQTCTDQACVNGSCVGECSPGATECQDAVSVKSCDIDGTWSIPESCNGQACVGASCTGVCEPNETQCANKFDLQTCTASGSWDTPKPCEGQACSGTACTGNCVPETLRCNNQSVQTCSNQGGWSNTQTCTGQTCVQSGDTAACQGNCAPGYQRCNNNSVQNCNASGSYSGTAENCTTSGETCVATGTTAACQGECAPGYQRCNGESVQNCNASGSYSGTAQDCTATGDICVESGTSASCADCAPGEQTCIDGEAYECDSGAWDLYDACGTEEICSDGVCIENTPYNIGNDVLFSPGGTANANELYLFKLPTVQNDAELVSLQFIGTLNDGTFARLALYQDNGGVPGQRIAVTSDVAVVNGSNGSGPTSAASVSAGTDYWLGIVFNATASIGRRSNGSAPIAYRVTSFTYGSTFPASNPGGSALIGVEFNVFITVRDTPE